MEYLGIGLVCYLCIGLGFSIASWLQAAEISVNEGKGIPSYFAGVSITFILIWWAMMIYCYRTEVAKTQLPIDFDKLTEKSDD